MYLPYIEVSSVAIWEYTSVIVFFVQQIREPEDFRLWHETMVTELPERMQRLDRCGVDVFLKISETHLR